MYHALQVAVFCISGMSSLVAMSLHCDESLNDRTLLLAGLRNADIEWDGTYLGLIARLKGRAKLLAESSDMQNVTALIDAIDDPNRFIAAHVILVTLTKAAVSNDPECWNGLRIDIGPDGKI